MAEITIPSVKPELILPLFGAKDQHLRKICDEFKVSIVHRNGEIRISGDDEKIGKAQVVLENLKAVVQSKGMLTPDDFENAMGMATGTSPQQTAASIDVVQVGRQVKPRTEGQARYSEAIRNHDVIIAVGPAGTGKTFLAVAMAVEALKHGLIRKIVLVRPAVEAGESLGFLPGDIHAKINPYLRPLLDAIHELMGYDQLRRLMEQDVIEVAPLAYMRGRTLNEAFIILDEAQNTTVSQMKMFLTRMGMGSKIVISGDTTQIDLPRNVRSGLTDAMRRLSGIKGVSAVELTRHDIVRHPLVQRIVQAYDEGET